jgi:hypothetical protein
MDQPIEHPIKQDRVIVPYKAANTTHEMAIPN